MVKQMDKTADYYEARITELQKEIDYLHGLLREANIEYVAFSNCIKTTDIRHDTMEVNQGARIVPTDITDRHVLYFFSLFKGRKDVYSKRGGKPNPKTGKTGYYTQCWNFWKDGICPKKDGHKINCSDCNNQAYKELNRDALRNHLVGLKSDCSDVIGIYPMLPDEKCNFLVFDFDNHDVTASGDDGANPDNEWVAEVNAMRDICDINNVPVIVERSRSGKGAHVWMFFDEPIPVYLARKFGSALLTKGAESVNLKNFRYYDRMIPTQDHIPVNPTTGKPGLGNLIALPLQGQALKKGNSAFIDHDWNAYPNQWQVLKDITKIKKSFVDEKISEWGGDGVLGTLCDIDQGEVVDSEKKDKTVFRQNPWEKSKLQFHSDDVQGEVRITISDRVYIDAENIKPRMQNSLRRLAAFSNPEFYKKMKMGFSTQGIPRIVFCGYDEAGYICLPRSLKDTILERLHNSNIEYSLSDLRQAGRTINVSFKGKLYEEQEEAVELMLQHENGILAATTAFGKTVVGAHMIAARKTNTLILVHNTEILKNWVEDLDRFLDIDEELPEYQTKTGRTKKRKSIIGKLYAGHNSMTGIVDVAMFSSLGKKDDINPIVQEYGMVIMDECHHGAAQTVEDVIGAVKAKYVYGLTATPKRDDGMEKKVYMQFGPIRYRYTAKQRAEKQGVAHYIYPRFTRLVSTEKLKITEAYRLVISSELRNQQIINDVIDCIENGRTPLVLSRYKEHAALLYERLKDKADHVFLLQGGGNRKEKDKARQKMRSVPENETVILVAIDKYIGEGFNFPRLDTLMLTMPISWEGNVEQYAGRLHRDYETKREVLIYDYVDSHIRVLEKMYHKRLRAYKKIGYEVCKNFTDIKQEANAIYDTDSYYPVFANDLCEANNSVVISSPGINKIGVNTFLKSITKIQENGVKISVLTLDPEGYPSEMIEPTRRLVETMQLAGVNVVLREQMHEHYAIIDSSIVWYGSMNFLSKAKPDDNIIRVESIEIASELMEMSFIVGK